MEKVKPYEKYKNSDVAWAGLIPSHWDALRSKRVLREVVKKGFPDEPLLAATQSKGVVLKSKYEFKTVVAVNNLETLKLVDPGNFVISLRSFQGGIEYAYDRGIISPAYTILELLGNNVHNYFRYLLKCAPYIDSLKLLVTGIREGQNIDTGKFKDSFLLCPPPNEQTAIARFLDYKTGQIDRFIRKKKQLIKLLAEQKAAIINQAVTKGINPNAPMKDSGIEWLGEIPAHWKIVKLAGVCNFVRGNSSFKKDELLSNGKYVALQYGKTYKVDVIDDKYQFYVNDEFYKDTQTVHYGDVIIISTSETIEDLGHSVVYNRRDLGLLGGEQVLLKPYGKVLSGKYLCNLSKAFATELRKNGTGVKVYRFNINDLKTVYVAIPTIDEQQQIVSYIEQETNIINTTISKIEQELALVEEYRTALIAEAVTGKIDVREYKIPETLKEEETYEDIEEEISIAAEDEAEYETQESE